MVLLPLRALLAAPLLLTHLLLSAAADEADEQYQFIARLGAEGHHELVVREARAFLGDYAQHPKADLTRYRLGISLFELGRHAEAAKTLQPLGTRDGFEFRAEALLRLGQCELGEGRLSEAVATFEAARTAGTEYVVTPATFLLGEAALQAEDWKRAQAAYVECLRREPDGEHAAHAARGQAWCEHRLGRSHEAVQLARAFLQRRKDHELAHEMRFLLADALLEGGDAKGASQAFRRVGKGNFAEAALRGEAFARNALDDREGAARAFGKLIEEFPRSRFRREAVLHRCALLLELDRADQARATLDVLEDANDAEVHYWRAKAVAATGEKEAALQWLTRALASRPTADLRERIHTLRGEVLFDLGRLEESARAFARSQSDYARHAAAVAHLNAGRPIEAIAEAEQLLTNHPNSPYAAHARLILGEARFARADWEGAARAFRTLIETRDTEPSVRSRALSRLAWCFHEDERIAEAAALFERVVAEHGGAPEAEEARFMLGRCAQRVGDQARARTAWRSYLAKHPDGPKLDQVLLGLARIDGDVKLLTRIVDEFENGEVVDEALVERARLHEQRGDHAAAAADHRALLEDFPQSPHVPSARYGLAWCLKSQGDARGATRVLTELLEGTVEEPLRIAALELQVWCAVEAGDLDLAVATWRNLDRVVADEERRFAGAQRVARALGAAQRTDEALQLLADLVRNLRDRGVAAAALVERAWLALDAGRAAAADDEVRAAARLAPTDADVIEAAFFVGEAYFEAAEHDRASRMYALAARAKESNLRDRALYKLGFAELRAERPGTAAAAFALLAQDHPRSPLRGESLYLCGEAHVRAGDHAKAVAPLEAMLAEYPRHDARAPALFRLGEAQLELGDAKAAQKHLAELARRFPDFAHRAEAELFRGRALARRQRNREARAAFDRVLDMDQGVLAARARIAIGELHLAADETEEALAEFLKVALLYAHAEEVAQASYLAGHTLELRGENDAALRQYTQLVEKQPRSPWTTAARERIAALRKR